MKKVGIWIDHRRAVLILLDEGGESRDVVENDLERHAGPEGSRRASTPYAPQAKDVERQVQARAQHQIQRFYREVIKRMGVPERLLVMGPAAAKQEFADVVRNDPALRGVNVTVAAADKMTEGQIAAHVRGAEF